MTDQPTNVNTNPKTAAPPEETGQIVEVRSPSRESAPVQLTRPSPGDYSGATSDEQLVELWLATKRSDHTKRAYEADVGLLLSALFQRGRTLRTATLADVQAWADGLTGAVATRARRLSAAKSLMTFGHTLGYLDFNVGGVLDVPKVPNTLAERILSEEEVHRLLQAVEGRDQVLIRFLYGSGARISEACGLRWEHVHRQDNDEAVVTLHGKGGKTRHVLLSASVAEALESLRTEGEQKQSSAPVFASRRGLPLHPNNIVKMIKRVARLATIDRSISPHWLRHAHASHALDRGAPIHLVQADLGHGNVATTGRYLHAKPGDGSSRYLSV